MSRMNVRSKRGPNCPEARDDPGPYFDSPTNGPKIALDIWLHGVAWACGHE
jgi:hypothetical protein